MGKADIITKDYMKEPLHFADAFNYYMFDGRPVVNADGLIGIDPTELGVIFTNDNKEFVQKIRDVLKSCVLMEDGVCAYLMMGIENHTNIHYALPVKNMIYDALNYGKQVADRSKEHKVDKDVKDEEFLSGFAKTDRIKPVVTLVVYFGAKEWDAPRSLKEMFEDVGEDILQFIPDYKVNLIIPKEIHDFSKFSTDFGKVMKYISVADQADLLANTSKEEAYRIADISSVRLLKEVVGLDIKINEEEKQVDMCKGLRDLTNRAMIQGAIESGRKFGATEEQIVELLMSTYDLQKDEAKAYCEQFSA